MQYVVQPLKHSCYLQPLPAEGERRTTRVKRHEQQHIIEERTDFRPHIATTVFCYQQMIYNRRRGQVDAVNNIQKKKNCEHRREDWRLKWASLPCLF